MQEELAAQRDDLLNESAALLKRSKYDDASDLPEAEVSRFVSRAEAAIHQVAARPSPYVDQSGQSLLKAGYTGFLARSLAGILQSLRADLAAGYVRSQRELLHAELFADFLEMAQHLLNEGDKDAAAVIAGSSLEARLRQLCQKAGISPKAEHAFTIRHADAYPAHPCTSPSLACVESERKLQRLPCSTA